MCQDYGTHWRRHSPPPLLARTQSHLHHEIVLCPNREYESFFITETTWKQLWFLPSFSHEYTRYKQTTVGVTTDAACFLLSLLPAYEMLFLLRRRPAPCCRPTLPLESSTVGADGYRPRDTKYPSCVQLSNLIGNL